MCRENPPFTHLDSLAGSGLDFSGAFRVPGTFSRGHANANASSHDIANASSFCFTHFGTITGGPSFPLPFALPGGLCDAGIPFGHFL